VSILSLRTDFTALISRWMTMVVVKHRSSSISCRWLCYSLAVRINGLHGECHFAVDIRASFFHLIDLRWFFPVNRISLLDFNIMKSSGSSTCVVPLTAIGRMLTGIVVPLIMLGQLLIIFGLSKIVAPLLGKCVARFKNSPGLTVNQLIRTLTSLFLYSCRNASATTTSIYQCCRCDIHVRAHV
jgi:hypothetical protein